MTVGHSKCWFPWNISGGGATWYRRPPGWSLGEQAVVQAAIASLGLAPFQYLMILTNLTNLTKWPPNHDISTVTAATARQTSRRSPASVGPGANGRRGAQIDVPSGMSVEEARSVLFAVASSAGTMARTGGTLTLEIGPAKRKGDGRFSITVALRPKVPTAKQAAAPPELTAAEARTALRDAYTRGADTAAELLAGPDMLSSDQIAARLGLSREAVLRKRRRGDFSGSRAPSVACASPRGSWVLMACLSPRCGNCTRCWPSLGPFSASCASGTPSSACGQVWKLLPTGVAPRSWLISHAPPAPSARRVRDTLASASRPTFIHRSARSRRAQRPVDMTRAIALVGHGNPSLRIF